MLFWEDGVVISEVSCSEFSYMCLIWFSGISQSCWQSATSSVHLSPCFHIAVDCWTRVSVSFTDQLLFLKCYDIYVWSLRESALCAFVACNCIGAGLYRCICVLPLIFFLFYEVGFMIFMNHPCFLVLHSNGPCRLLTVLMNCHWLESVYTVMFVFGVYNWINHRC